MCVEIIKNNGYFSYNMEMPFKEQILGSHEVLIDCKPTCPKVKSFLKEVEQVCKNGQTLPIQIKLAENNNLKLFKQTKEINKNLLYNDIISNMVLFQKNLDDKLKELSEMCTKL